MKCIVLLGLLLLKIGPAYSADYISVKGFEYQSRNTGSRKVISPIHSGQVSAKLYREIEAKGINIVSIALHCGGSPGPRFLQLNRNFYTLNGKSARENAHALTDDGSRYPIIDTRLNPSPLADSSRLVQKLIDEAGAVC